MMHIHLLSLFLATLSGLVLSHNHSHTSNSTWIKIYECTTSSNGQLLRSFDLFNESEIKKLAAAATKVKITPASGDDPNYTLESLPNTSSIQNLRRGLELSFRDMRWEGDPKGYFKHQYTDTKSEWSGTTAAKDRLLTNCGLSGLASGIKTPYWGAASTPRTHASIAWYSADCTDKGIHIFSHWRRHSNHPSEPLSSRCEWGKHDTGSGIAIYLNADLATVLPQYKKPIWKLPQTSNLTEQSMRVFFDLTLDSRTNINLIKQMSDYCGFPQLFVGLEQSLEQKIKPNVWSAKISTEWDCHPKPRAPTIVEFAVTWHINRTVSQIADSAFMGISMQQELAAETVGFMKNKAGYTYVFNVTIASVEVKDIRVYPLPENENQIVQVVSVKKEEKSDSGLSTLNIVFIAVIAALACCILILCCVWCRKRKSSDEGMASTGRRKQAVVQEEEGERRGFFSR